MPFSHESGATVLDIGTCHMFVQNFTPEHNTHPLRISSTPYRAQLAWWFWVQHGVGGMVSSYVGFALLTLWPLWWVSLILSALTSLYVE